MKSKAQLICEKMDFQLAKPINSLDDLKYGRPVIFKKGHPYEGLLARVINTNKDGTVNVKIGKTLKTNVATSDLLLAPGHQ